LAITATSGSASAQVEARRPSWSDMDKHYPDTRTKTPELYDQKIGGRFKGLYLNPGYQNTCAVRMSYALNRSGLKLAAAPSPGGSIPGADGYQYWIRVSDLKQHLAKRFRGADEELQLSPISASLIGENDAISRQFKERVKTAQAWLDTKLARRNGIVVFEVSGWGDASGHFTLWNGVTRTLAYAEGHDDPQTNMYYFWLTNQAERANGTTALIQVVAVKFWELK